jgi:hypothetical protein
MEELGHIVVVLFVAALQSDELEAEASEKQVGP